MVKTRIDTTKVNRFRRTFLVSFREEIIPINIHDIAFFAVDEVSTVLGTGSGKKFRINEPLERIEQSVDPVRFFRANRQYLIAHHAIKRIEYCQTRKLLVELSIPDMPPIAVSRARAKEFLSWMELGYCEEEIPNYSFTR